MNPILKKFSETPRIKESLDAFKMHESPGLEIVHLHLEPGAEIPLHINPIDVVFCIMEGNATVVTASDTIHAEKYDLVEVPAGIERGMKNTGDSSLRLMVFKKV